MPTTSGHHHASFPGSEAVLGPGRCSTKWPLHSQTRGACQRECAGRALTWVPPCRGHLPCRAEPPLPHPGREARDASQAEKPSTPSCAGVPTVLSSGFPTGAEALGATALPFPVGGKHQDSVGLLLRAVLGPRGPKGPPGFCSDAQPTGLKQH